MKTQSWRMILAVGLSMAIFYLYSKYMLPPPPPPAPTPIAQETPQPTPATPVPLEKTPESTSVSGIPTIKASTPTQPGMMLENEAIQLNLNSQGFLDSWVLKKFGKAPEKESDRINLFQGDTHGQGFLLTLGLPEYDAQPLHTLEKNETTAKAIWQSDSLVVSKNFSMGLQNNPYGMDVVITLENKGPTPITVTPRVWLQKEQKHLDEKGLLGFLKPKDPLVVDYVDSGKLTTQMNWKKMPSKTEVAGRLYWTGLSDRYFLMSLITRQESANTQVSYGLIDKTLYTALSYGTITLAPGEKVEKKYSAYLGPKKRDELKALGSHLELAVDYGYFGFIAIPLLISLTFLEKVIGNWGLAIILLTFIVKLLLHPVNKKSMESMKAMQKLQPRLQEIREKFKDNKERLNMEMMSLFKTNKVNPMGGCLPMLLQMPVYIGLYKVLWNAIELYHTPFFWFYKDLAAPDPTFVMPILLGILMVLQQKLTPSPATVDPAQQKMMMFMPLMFSGFMIFLPFGLVLYISVNTGMSVIQQYMIHREMSFMDLLKKITGKN